ncbi:MAG: hypothetical protein ACI9S8_002872 [Chlamydiales bacterium]|jgi:hypothetical protein
MLSTTATFARAKAQVAQSEALTMERSRDSFW